MGNGFESHSGFRDAFARTFGQAPGRSRTGDCVVCAWIDSPLGPLVAGATAQGICLLEFTDRRMLPAQIETVRRRFGCAVVPGESPHFDQLRNELNGLFFGTAAAVLAAARGAGHAVPGACVGRAAADSVWRNTVLRGSRPCRGDGQRAARGGTRERHESHRDSHPLSPRRQQRRKARRLRWAALAEGGAPAPRAHRTARGHLAVFRDRRGGYANPSSSVRRS